MKAHLSLLCAFSVLFVHGAESAWSAGKGGEKNGSFSH